MKSAISAALIPAVKSEPGNVVEKDRVSPEGDDAEWK